MRRILITDRVKGIARDYRDNLFKGRNVNFEKPKDRLQALLDDINIKKGAGYYNWSFYSQYLQNLINHYDDLLDLKPSEFKSYYSLYFSDPRGLLAEKKWRKKTKAGRSPFYEEVVKLMRYEDVREKEIIPYLAQLEIHTCVYCNTQYTPTIHVKKGRLIGGFELDHNFPKSKYPFLCTSFFNLYPVCANCNGWKVGREAEFVLYSEDPTQLNPFSFKLDRASIIKYMLFQDPELLEIVFDSNDKTLLSSHNLLFHTEKYYGAFREVAEELIWKSKTRNAVYKRQLIDSFLKLFPRKHVDVDRFLYGFYFDPKDIHRRPLTKLQQDIAKQLNII